MKKDLKIRGRDRRLLKWCDSQVGELLNYEKEISVSSFLSLGQRKRLEKTRRRLEVVVQKRGDASEEVLEVLAKVYEGLREYEKAIKILKKISEVNPKDTESLEMAAWCTLAKDDIDACYDFCQQALERGSRSGFLYVNLALVNLLRGDIPATRKALMFAFNTNKSDLAMIVASVIDWCEMKEKPYPVNYEHFLKVLEAVKQIEFSKENNYYNDPLMDDARRLVQETGVEMQSFLAKQLQIDYARAGYLLDGLEADGSIEESPTWLYEQHLKVYLDIDGVLLANDKQAAHGVYEFVKHLVNRYSVYWLTTYCRNPGDDPLSMLSRFLDKKTMVYLEKVQPVYWDVLKTEAIDFDSEFAWFDDNPLEADKKVLEKYGVLGSWVKIDLMKDPHQLSEEVPLSEPENDPMLVDAIKLVNKEGEISVCRMQEVFKISYARAVQLLRVMREREIVG